MQFADKIRDLKNKHGVKPLAKTLGVSHRTVEGWLQGRSARMSIVKLVDAIEAGKVPVWPVADA